MITASGLTKLYGSVRAVTDVSFCVKHGETVGLLGPNGAGKSTTLRILACILAPTAGTAEVAGYDILRHSLDVRRHLGYMPENISLYPEMTIRSYLDFVGKMKGLRRQARHTRIEHVIEELDLGQMARRYIETLSKGYRQRVGLAQALLHDPDVLILDEPTIGLDPEQAAEFRRLIRGMQGQRTVILSTHILPEVRRTCDRVMIINQGNILALDTPGNLTLKLRDTSELLVQIDGPQHTVMDKLRSLPGVQDVSSERLGDGPDHGSNNAGPISYTVQADANTEIRPAIIHTATAQGWRVFELRSREMELEEIFHRVLSADS